jgi:cellulose biosynthesis protein BcsQ
MLKEFIRVFVLLKDQWSGASTLLKLLLILGFVAVVFLVAASADSIPLFSSFQSFFERADPRAQTATLCVIFVISVISSIAIYDGYKKTASLQDQIDKIQQDCEGFRKDAAASQARWDKLLDVETKERLWQRPCTTKPPWVPPGQRKTRFVTTLNLKGGVGKTTVTANLAATLALDHKLRVLLVDIDFQGTLGDAAVDPKYVSLQQDKGDTVVQLLRHATGTDILPRLVVDMNHVPGCKVVLANDRLEHHDYSLQARFFVNPHEEVRLFFLQHFHTAYVFENFDLVLFDCPPRLTTSTVNALACSDVVLVPTKLDLGSVKAVPRTIEWLHTLYGVVPARLLGVVATQTALHKGQLTKQDNTNYGILRVTVAQHLPGLDMVLAATVPSSSKAVNLTTGVVAAVDEESRALYRKVADELKGRLRL